MDKFSTVRNSHLVFEFKPFFKFTSTSVIEGEEPEICHGTYSCFGHALVLEYWAEEETEQISWEYSIQANRLTLLNKDTTLKLQHYPDSNPCWENLGTFGPVHCEDYNSDVNI